MEKLPSNHTRTSSSSTRSYSSTVVESCPELNSPTLLRQTLSPPPLFSPIPLTPSASILKTTLLSRAATPVYFQELKRVIAPQENMDRAVTPAYFRELKSVNAPTERASNRMFFPPAPPTYTSHLPEPEILCAACHKPLSSEDSKLGPNDTVLHKWCYLCGRCGEVVERQREGIGGDGVDEGEMSCEIERSCGRCGAMGERERGKRVVGCFDGVDDGEVARGKRRRGWWCCCGRR